MKLFEIMAAGSTQLSHEQQLCLLKIYMTSVISDEVAIRAISGDTKLMAAAEYLIKSQYLQPSPNGLVITNAGKSQLLQAGLTDSMGVTDMGRELLNQPVPKKFPKNQPSSTPTSSV